jgi:hypothetical protein
MPLDKNGKYSAKRPRNYYRFQFNSLFSKLAFKYAKRRKQEKISIKRLSVNLNVSTEALYNFEEGKIKNMSMTASYIMFCYMRLFSIKGDLNHTYVKNFFKELSVSECDYTTPLVEEDGMFKK